MKFGRWTVVEKTGRKWTCKCDCGNVRQVDRYNLANGVSKSCGCLKLENTIKRSTKHGLGTNTKLYGVWSEMKQRCFNKNHKKYERYGARGITICDEWSDFKNFYDWCMQNGYQDGLTIDRVNNDESYGPDNCRFTTAKVQANNTSRNVMITIHGVEDTLAEHARRYGIHPETLKYRYTKGLRDDELLKKGRITISKN